jgi:hypothetical protein
MVLAFAQVNTFPPLPDGDFFPLKPGGHWVYQGSHSYQGRFSRDSHEYKRNIRVSLLEQRGDTVAFRENITDSIFNRIHADISFTGETVSSLKDTVMEFRNTILKTDDSIFILNKDGIDVNKLGMNFFNFRFSRGEGKLTPPVSFSLSKGTLNGNQVEVYTEAHLNHRITRLAGIGIWTYKYSDASGGWNRYESKDSLLEFSIDPSNSISEKNRSALGIGGKGSGFQRSYDILGRDYNALTKERRHGFHREFGFRDSK